MINILQHNYIRLLLLSGKVIHWPKLLYLQKHTDSDTAKQQNHGRWIYNCSICNLMFSCFFLLPAFGVKNINVKTHCKGDSHSSKTANIILSGLMTKWRWMPLTCASEMVYKFNCMMLGETRIWILYFACRCVLNFTFETGMLFRGPWLFAHNCNVVLRKQIYIAQRITLYSQVLGAGHWKWAVENAGLVNVGGHGRMENPEESIVKANKTNETYTVTWKCMTYVNCEQPCSQVVSTHADQSSIVSQGLSSCG